MKTLLIRKIQLTSDVFQFDFKCALGKLSFKAGQFVSVKVPGTDAWRSYSIVSSPSRKDGFSLCIKIITGGIASTFFAGLAEGATVDFDGPSGSFTLGEGTSNIVMIATGVGIVPFMSMLSLLPTLLRAQKVRLLFGVRNKEDLFYLDELEEFKRSNPNFDFFVTLSRPPEGWTGLRGRVTDHLEMFCSSDRGSSDASNTQFYICGGGEAVKDVRTLLIQKGVLPVQIRLEQFSAIGVK